MDYISVVDLPVACILRFTPACPVHDGRVSNA